MTRYLIFGFTFAFAAAVQPGPFQAFLVSQTMTAGWRRTAVAAFAPLLSDGPIIVLVLLVLSQVPPGFVQILQIGGGLFLLFLASRALRACRDYAALQALAATLAELDTATGAVWQEFNNHQRGEIRKALQGHS